LCLTATDTGGLSASDCRPIWPRTGLVQLRTVPLGLELLMAGTLRNSPYDVAVQVDAVREVQAAQPGWTLVGWNDGLPGATRTLTGTLATQTLTATYTNTAPVAVAAAGPVTGWAPLPVAVTATASYDPDGPSVTYHWAFGDGGVATTANVTHVFNYGVYTATLTVTTSGLTDTPSCHYAQRPPLLFFSGARLPLGRWTKTGQPALPAGPSTPASGYSAPPAPRYRSTARPRRGRTCCPHCPGAGSGGRVQR
jgi:hypothetical protein